MHLVLHRQLSLFFNPYYIDQVQIYDYNQNDRMAFSLKLTMQPKTEIALP